MVSKITNVKYADVNLLVIMLSVGGVLKSMLTLNEAIIDVKEG